MNITYNPHHDKDDVNKTHQQTNKQINNQTNKQTNTQINHQAVIKLSTHPQTPTDTSHKHADTNIEPETDIQRDRKRHMITYHKS